MVVLLLCMILDIYTLIAYIIINKEIKGGFNHGRKING